MEQAFDLLKRLGMPAEDIEQLGRWDRINAIRLLSAAAAADGTEFGVKLGSKFARREKINTQEMQRQRQAIAHEIFIRQAAVLGGVEEHASGSESESDDDLGDRLESLLAEDDAKASKVHAREAAAVAAADDDEAALRDMVKEGFITSQPEGLAGQAKKKLEAVPGERRIRRTLIWALPDGSTQTQERVITDKEKRYALNQLYVSDGPGRDPGLREAAHPARGGRLPGAPPGQAQGPGSRPAPGDRRSHVTCKACGQVP
eukprot:jgi/Botrbrau1/7852/Bobra.9_2s0028.1